MRKREDEVGKAQSEKIHWKSDDFRGRISMTAKSGCAALFLGIAFSDVRPAVANHFLVAIRTTVLAIAHQA